MTGDELMRFAGVEDEGIAGCDGRNAGCLTNETPLERLGKTPTAALCEWNFVAGPPKGICWISTSKGCRSFSCIMDFVCTEPLFVPADFARILENG